MIKAGEVEIQVSIPLSQVTRALDRMERNTRKFDRAATRSFRRVSAEARVMTAAMRGLNQQLRLMGTLLLAGGAGVGSVRLLADFAQTMSTVRAITGSTAQEFSTLEREARRLGQSTRFTATQAAEGMLYLARAGFDVNEVMASIGPTLRLAQAGALDLGRAADLSSNILQAYELDVTELGRVIDVLAAAANSSNTSVEQLGEAMKYAAPVAQGFGISIEETAAAISVLSNRGIQATMAGTGLRNILGRIASGGAQFEQQLHRYGLTLEDVNVEALGLTEVMTRMERAGIGANEAFELFNLRGGNIISILSRSGPELQRFTAAYERAGGTAERVARIMDDNLNGALLQTLSATQGLILAFGNLGANGVLMGGLQGVAAALRDVTSLLEGNGSAAAETEIILKGLAVTAGVLMVQRLGALVIATVASSRTWAAWRLSVILAGQAGAAQIVMLHGLRAAMNLLLGPVGIALTAIALLTTAWVNQSRSVQEIAARIEALQSKISDLNRQIQEDEAQLAALVEATTAAIEEQGDAARDTATLEIDQIRQRIAANEELKHSYETLMRAQLADADVALRRQRERLVDTFGGNVASLSERVGVQGMPADISREELEGRVMRWIAAQRDLAFAAQDAGQELTSQQRRVLELWAAYQDARMTVDGLREGVAALNEEFDSNGNGNGDGDNGLGDRTVEYNQMVQSLENAVATLSRARGIERDIVQNLIAAGLEPGDTGEQAQVIIRLTEQLRHLQTLDGVTEAITSRQTEYNETLAALNELLSTGTINASQFSIALNQLGLAQDLRALDESLTGTEFSQEAQIQNIRDQHAERLQVLREALEEELITEEGYAARKEALYRDTADRIQRIEAERFRTQLQDGQNAFGALTDLARTYAGEQSGIFKALFAAQQAFALAIAIINLHQAISEANKLPWPANIPAIAFAAAQGGAAIAGIAAATVQGFAQGGYTGSGGTGEVAGVVHGQEFVVNANATRKNLPALEAMNRGEAIGMGMQVIVENHGVDIDIVREKENRMRIVAREAAENAVREKGPQMVGETLRNPSSAGSRALGQVTSAKRVRP